MRLEATQRDTLALIPKPCVVGSNPTGGAKSPFLCRAGRVHGTRLRLNAAQLSSSRLPSSSLVGSGAGWAGGAIETTSPSISSTISGCPDAFVMPAGLAELRWIPIPKRYLGIDRTRQRCHTAWARERGQSVWGRTSGFAGAYEVVIVLREDGGCL